VSNIALKLLQITLKGVKDDYKSSLKRKNKIGIDEPVSSNH